MVFVSGSWLVDVALLLATLVSLLYCYLSRNNTYFKDRGIPYIKPTPFIGSWDAFSKSQYDLSRKLYESHKDDKFFGYFQSTVPCLVVNDPELIQRILVKDFAHFTDRPLPSSDHDPLNRNLFELKGQHWRVLRHKLTPTFSTGKIKKMFNQLIQCADILVEDVRQASLKQESMDTNEMIMKLTIEVIGNLIFGLDLGRDTKEFNEKAKEMFSNDGRQFLVFVFQLVAPKLLKVLNITLFPQSVNDYFCQLTKIVKEHRKKNNLKRDDYFQLLLTLQEAEESGKSVSMKDDDQDDYDLHSSQEHQLPDKMFRDEDLVAHAFVFLVAGTETVTSTLSLALYLIAKNPQVKSKIKEDVHRAIEKHQGWTYEAVKDMTYLDQVIQETQRMYPAAPLNDRECTIPYTIPDTDIVLEKGTYVNIPVAGLHMDPRYYPNPEVFNPDRFADNAFKPSAIFMPFGNGPRMCIAMRFAVLEMKICLAKIFYEFSAELNSKTKEPLTFDVNSFSPRPEGNIWITFTKNLSA